VLAEVAVHAHRAVAEECQVAVRQQQKLDAVFVRPPHAGVDPPLTGFDRCDTARRRVRTAALEKPLARECAHFRFPQRHRQFFAQCRRHSRFPG